MTSYNKTSVGFCVALCSLLAVSMLLGGCTAVTNTENDAVARLAALSAVDLNAALADATANGDKRAMACYPALAIFIADLQTWQARPAPGIVSRFQKQRDIDKVIIGGPSVELEIACMALVADVKKDARDLVAKFFTLLAQAISVAGRLP